LKFFSKALTQNLLVKERKTGWYRAMDARKIIILSDGTGETAARVIKAAMVQFGAPDVEFIRHKNIRQVGPLEAICQDALQNKSLVIYTLASPELRKFVGDFSKKNELLSIDVLGPLLTGISGYLGFEPSAVSGLLHNVNAQYFKKIEAMEYTVHHDDGKDLTQLDRADLVILGLSRTSKTPLSIYLAHHGWKVVNIPLIYGFEIPEELMALDQRRIVGLTIDMDDLTRIRRARIQKVGQDQGGDYADPIRVAEELEWANELFKRNRKWAIFNVTDKALEETASEIIKLMSTRKLAPSAI
jgi:regulator of PEP synthase PpsR (kinase-PPPase family)